MKNGSIKLTVADILASDAVFYQDQNADGKFKQGEDSEIMRVVPGTRITLGFSYKFN